MNNIILQTIRVGIVAGVAFFALVDSALAAPTLLPTSVVEITSNSASLRGYLQNYGESSVVWFEWSEASSATAPTVIAMKNFYGDGFFGAHLDGLKPDTIYSYRAAVKTGGGIGYSPVSSFKTLSQEGPLSQTATAQSNQGGALGLGPITAPQTPTQVTAPVSANKNTVQPVEVKKEVVPTKTDGFTNNNAAAVIGAGNGLLPTTLIGWILLIIAVLVLVLIGDMIYKSFEKRKKALEDKKLLDEKLAQAKASQTKEAETETESLSKV